MFAPNADDLLVNNARYVNIFAVERALDLCRENVRSAGDDHVDASIHDVRIAVLIEPTDISPDRGEASRTHWRREPIGVVEGRGHEHDLRPLDGAPRGSALVASRIRLPDRHPLCAPR